MTQATEREYRDHLVQADVFFDSDIRQWHVGCVITRRGKEPGNRIACPNPMYAPNEQDAIEMSLRFGKRLVDSGLVWD